MKEETIFEKIHRESIADMKRLKPLAERYHVDVEPLKKYGI